MIIIDGEKVNIDSIVRIDGMYVYTKEGLKIHATKDEMKEILEKFNNLHC